MATMGDEFAEMNRYGLEIARIRGKLGKLVEESFIREAEGADHYVFWKLDRLEEEKQRALATCQFLAVAAITAEEKRLGIVAKRVSLRQLRFALAHCKRRFQTLKRMTRSEECLRIAWAWVGRTKDPVLAERTTLRRTMKKLRADIKWYESELGKEALPPVSLETIEQIAADIAWDICDCVLATDERIRKLLGAPGVLERYDYDGEFFYPKGTDGFHRAFDGTHVLSSLTDSCLEAFFIGYSPLKENAEELIRWLTVNNIWITEIRIANWEAYGTLALIPPRDLEELVAEYKEMQARSKIEPLSDEERQFFDILEQQMKKTE